MRLIDADALIALVQDSTILGDGFKWAFCALVNGEPTIKPERKKMSNKEWVDFLSDQFCISRTSARNMLHGMLKWKEWDNFKSQYSGGR